MKPDILDPILFMNAIQKIKEVTGILLPCGIESAEREAELMIRYGLHIDPVTLYNENRDLEKHEELMIQKMVDRRTAREPLQYILGSVDFMDLHLNVSEGVLIPRPETELMAEYAIKKVKSYELRGMSERQNIEPQRQDFGILNKKLCTPDLGLCILDLCTGSGCLALSIAKVFPDAHITGCDDSEDALHIAEKNAEMNNIKNVRFIRGDLFDAVPHEDNFDMIISNPPYIKTDEIKGLQPEIRDWEPLKALDGGDDGLDYYRLIVPESVHFLRNNGILIFEHGDGQSDDIAGILRIAGFKAIEAIKDYSGKERFIQARWTK
ncbi:MAG: peptide chain release factor N(5)-glutamine methyltransferase [Nitrospiraceae bacterium]|nr:MAG: peptide chain release factor N(5)-glutamine methyltransferase [Nitrospiraceae bacterium]